MKRYFFFFVLTLFSFASCNSVRVAADYDRSVTFETYQSFAFFKEGIDKAEISDLDKRRILRAIESEMLAKGFVKSCLLYTSPSPRDISRSRMPSSA